RKSVIIADPKQPKEKKEQLIRAFAHALRDAGDYIFGPDMGTNEESMAWVRDEIGRSVGLPREIGGIPLDEIGATGWGLFQAAQVAVPYCDFELSGAKVVVQGFGSVGKHAARFLNHEGALLVGTSDSSGGIYNQGGLDVSALIQHKSQHLPITSFPGGTACTQDDILDMACDIWIPAARPDVVNEDNVSRLNTKLVLQGANIPFTHGAEKQLHQQGVCIVPDFIANAGGVICAAMEYQGTTESIAMQVIEDKIRRNTEEVLTISHRDTITPREAATKMAMQRVNKAMGFRRWNTFSNAPNYL
ncbi:MAG TPA: Glu/Leu/Phe/Val dehydrogenase, partial [Gammaproteobacteria bacterium]|nr:Glu/Leu/Phe/Val dehydrogenase [Gammaproteobacteria bacterium]